ADAWAGGMSGPSAPGSYGPGLGDIKGGRPGGQPGYAPPAGGLAGHGPVGGGAGRTGVSRPAGGGSSHGGGIGRARIKEAPCGAAAAAMEAVAVGQEAANAPANVAPRQPWYQVVGGPAASRSAQVIGVAEAASQANQVGTEDARLAAHGGQRAA